MDFSILKKIDLKDKDIKIYLALLENGAQSVRNLVSFTKLNRGTIYDILKKLQERNLVNYYHQNTKQKFIAQNPEKILKIINNQEIEFKQTKEDIQKLIPELKCLEKKGNDKPTVKFYEGKKGIKFILEDILESLDKEEKKQYYIYSAKKNSTILNEIFPDFTKERIKRKIEVKAISLAKGGKTYGLDKRRWLGSNENSATFTIIYAKKIAFISRDKNNNPIGIILENEIIWKTQKIIFQGLWEKLS